MKLTENETNKQKQNDTKKNQQSFFIYTKTCIQLIFYNETLKKREKHKNIKRIMRKLQIYFLMTR